MYFGEGRDDDYHRSLSVSVALEEELLKDLKTLAQKRGVPYQVLMRLMIADGIKRLKKAA